MKRLPEVVSALNNEITRLIGKKPAEAIKEKAVSFKPSTTYSRPVGLKEKKLPLTRINVRYLYQPAELVGGGRRVFNIEKAVTKPKKPILYYLYDGPKRGFVREELKVVPPGRQLPPASV